MMRHDDTLQCVSPSVINRQPLHDTNNRMMTQQHYYYYCFPLIYIQWQNNNTIIIVFLTLLLRHQFYSVYFPLVPVMNSIYDNC